MGQTGAVKHYTGSLVYGEATALRDSVATRKDYADEVSTVTDEEHDRTLARVSAPFRNKVRAARSSGRLWIHQIGHDSGDAEIHRLQCENPDGSKMDVTYLERNGSPWKKAHPGR